MQRYSVSALLVLSILSIFWAYTVMDTLLRDFAGEVTFLDLGVLVVLGFIAGVGVGLIPAAARGGHRGVIQ
jgi:hypothetical protein